MDCRECKCKRCYKSSSFTPSYESDSEESQHRHQRKRRYTSSSDDPDSENLRESQHQPKRRRYTSSSDDPDSGNLRVDDYQSFQERKLIKKYYQKSKKYIELKRFEKALSSIEAAIVLYNQGVPTNEKMLSKLYSRRGTIRTLLEMPRLSFQGLLDFERGHIIDKNNKESRVNMSKYFFAAANKFFKMKDYAAAAKYSKYALRLNSENAEACELIEKIISKEKRDLRTMDEIERNSKDLFPKSNVSENGLRKRSMHPKIVKDKQRELKSLYKMINTALQLKNYTRAVIYVNHALGHLKDLHDDKKYRELLELKQKIKKFIKPEF